jgi:hypothetical protein
MTSVQELTAVALSSSPDLSADLRTEVAEQARAVAAATGAHVVARFATDYSVSHMIEISLGENGDPVRDVAEQRYLLKAAVSLVAPAWTVFLYQRVDERTWVPSSQPVERVVPSDVWRKIEDLMAEKGRCFVATDALGESVPGARTELDGAPATVKDVLFCELC